MKETRHELLKQNGKKSLGNKRRADWPSENGVNTIRFPHQAFFYWTRVIRQDLLIKAGTMAVTGQTQFSEITPEVRRLPTNTSEICAVTRMHSNEVEIYNGADPDTLESIVS